jgi:hypothetical protein
MDYSAPLNLIKPFRMTTGDWYTMTQTIFGAFNIWPVNGSATIGSDCAVLTEFSAKSIAAGKTLEVGRTSYGTGEYEKCIGQLFSLVFYPHHLVWDSTQMKYSPNPIHIEKFVVDPSQVDAASNTKITLTVGNNLTISDSLCGNAVGKSQTKPDTIGNGQFIGPGDVHYFDWWACADPALLCTESLLDTLKFTGVSSLGPPMFLGNQGDDECELPITLDCAESDIDAPQFKDSLFSQGSEVIYVHDWRTTDKGLQSITWSPVSGTDTTKVIVLPPSPAIKPCFTDKLDHIVKVIQRDSTIGGCYDFTFTDCLEHQSFHTVCMQAHRLQILYSDSLPPVFTFIKQSRSRDSSPCSNRIDSFEVTDNRTHDSGMCALDTIPGSVSNMTFHKTQFNQGDLIVRSSVIVLDSMKDGNICIRATDCSKEVHFTDTCFHYCAPVQGSVHRERPSVLTLEANHPNPFSRITTFTFSIPEYGAARLILYDELGKEVARIIDGTTAQGTYSINFDGSKLPSGNYIVRLENGGGVVSRRVVVER